VEGLSEELTDSDRLELREGEPDAEREGERLSEELPWLAGTWSSAQVTSTWSPLAMNS